MWDHTSNPNEPPPSWLTAYFDGELCGEAREQVEAWLAAHPEAVRWLEDEERLMRLVRQSAAPDPEPDRWAQTLSRISAAVAATTPATAAPASWRHGKWIAAAAAVLLVGTLAMFWPHGEQPSIPEKPDTAQTTPEEDMTPFSVASAEDVTIQSMDAADERFLIAARPPVEGPIILASSGDVQVDRMEPHADGAIPDFRQPLNGTPMVVGPLLPAWGGD